MRHRNGADRGQPISRTLGWDAGRAGHARIAGSCLRRSRSSVIWSKSNRFPTEMTSARSMLISSSVWRWEMRTLLEERYRDATFDGPVAYADFLAKGDTDQHARDRQEAVAMVRLFLRRFRE